MQMKKLIDLNRDEMLTYKGNCKKCSVKIVKEMDSIGV